MFDQMLAASLEEANGGGPVPGLVIYGNYRSVLALIGIVTLVLGVWHVDRTWDEMGSATYKRLVDAAGGSTSDIVIPEADLDAAFPFPWAFLLGWAIFGISYLFRTHPNDYDGSVTDISGPNIICLFLCLALGVIASVPMGDAVRNRNGPKKKKLGGMFVLCWILLSIFTGLDEDWGARNNGLCIVLCLIGAITIIASMKILWAARKMGDTWEQEAKPNPHPVVYNMGGPMFIFGWFVFWVSMATVTNLDDTLTDLYCNIDGIDCGLPIFFNVRTALTFASGCGMVPIVMMLDYAHDEGGEYVGFGTDGKYFGRFLETPVPFLSAWSIFGLATLFDLENGFDYASDARTWVVIGICILQGIVAGVLIQTALYEGDMERKNKWSIVFVLLFLALAINLGFTSDYSELNANGLGLLFGILGAGLVILGQKTVFGDRKRGDYFMQNNGAVNPNPIVYSYGEIFFMTGWIMLALAQSWNYASTKNL